VKEHGIPIRPLDAGFVDEILALQQRCWEYDGGIFILSSRA
jgi:hypothetical protein